MRTEHRTWKSLVIFCLLAGCNGSPDGDVNPARTAYDGTPLVDGFNPPDPPADALQLVSPIIRDLAPGTNVELCYYTTHILTEPLALRAGQGFQALGGHHVVVYWGADPKPEGLHECTDNDMINLHVLTGGGAEAGNGIINNLPAGGVFHVPAGAQLVMNIHALNASSKPVDTQAVVNLYYGDPSLKSLTSYYVTGTDVNVPPHSKGSYSASCIAPRDFDVVRGLAHMHEWGTRAVLSLDDGTGEKAYYDKPGSPDFSYNPPWIDFSTDKPLHIAKGTKIIARCEYNNTGADPLIFPTEMCAAFGYLIGTEAEFGCTNEVWNHQ